ncbi:MAG: hypothetical protein ABSC30_10005 [Acidimicrobiales bacterium]|jgi:hypothetical protein
MSQTPSGACSQEEVGFYEIRLRGHLAPRWTTRLDVLSLTNEGDGTTTIRARAVDQAALHGLLDKIRDLGLTLISVAALDRTGPDDSPIVAQ